MSAPPAPWPELPTRRLARHLRDAASVDPDRRQDPAGALALAESFLARRALCHRARPDHLADPRRHQDLPDRLRLHRSRLADFDQRRRAAAVCAGRAIGRELLRGCHGRARRTRHRRRNRRDAERIAGPDPVFAGPHARVLRSGRGAALLPDPRQCRSGVQAIPHRLSRQGEPGAFLLGQFRSRGDAVFRAGARRAIPAACRICPTRSRAKPIRTK